MVRIYLLILVVIFNIIACENNNKINSNPEIKKKLSNYLKINRLPEQKELAGSYLFKNTKKLCVPKKDMCPVGFNCVENKDKKNTGVCLKVCDKKNPDCPVNLYCMPKYSSDLTSLGNYCQKQQKYKNMPCVAPNDPNACAGGLQCRATLVEQDKYGAYKCIEECLKNSDCFEEGEECLEPDFAPLEKQKDSSNKFILCSVKNCQGDGQNCACDSGFSCSALKSDPKHGLCTRQWGVCGNPIFLPKLSDFSGTSYMGETCNEMRGRYCYDFPDDSSSQVAPMCRIISSSGEGICLAPCSTPSLDLNLNNIILPNEKGVSFSCPKNYTCKTDVSRKLKLYKFITYKNKKIACDITKCEREKVCPGECGLGDAECLPVDGGVCGAPFGLCEK